MGSNSQYSGKLKTAEEALQRVESGMRVFVHASSGYPFALMAALAERAPALRNVEICHLLTYNPVCTAAPQYASSFRHTCFFIGSDMREPVAAGRADYVPIHLGQVEQLATQGRPMDVALIQVSPPDEHGFVSLGAAVEVTAAFARAARHVIAQVNSCTPWTCGESQLHVSEIDAFVECSHPLAEFPLHPPTETEQRIARHIVPLIEDGAPFRSESAVCPMPF
jgi:acyl-CoA hydrolase